MSNKEVKAIDESQLNSYDDKDRIKELTRKRVQKIANKIRELKKEGYSGVAIGDVEPLEKKTEDGHEFIVKNLVYPLTDEAMDIIEREGVHKEIRRAMQKESENEVYGITIYDLREEKK